MCLLRTLVDGDESNLERNSLIFTISYTHSKKKKLRFFFKATCKAFKENESKQAGSVALSLPLGPGLGQSPYNTHTTGRLYLLGH